MMLAHCEGSAGIAVFLLMARIEGANVDIGTQSIFMKNSKTNAWSRRNVMAAIALVSCGLMFQGSAGAATPSSQDRLDLKRISDYLNALSTLQGQFSQIDDDGTESDGVFFLQRPGKLRFEYISPSDSPTLVASGKWVTLENHRLNTVNRYPLKATPLKLLLKKNVDLTKDTDIIAIDRSPGILSITARERAGKAQGELTMVFAEPILELRHWVVRDAQGYTTTVSLTNVRRDTKIAPALFIPADK